MDIQLLSRVLYSTIGVSNIKTSIPSGIRSRLLRAMCERRVSSQHMAKSFMLNPYMSLLNVNFEPIFVQQILILDPPYTGLFGPSWSELSPRVICRGWGVDWAGDNFLSWTET